MTTVLPPERLDEAVAALADGELVAFPTETVYGLGADAGRSDAVAQIFAAKGRPVGHPLIVHISDLANLDRYAARVTPQALALAEAFWPGPLTLVVDRTDAVAPETTGGLGTVALRVPDQPVAMELLERFGGGIAAPSANRFGSVSPTTARHVVDDLGDVVNIVLDGGRSAIGVESTIVDVSGTGEASGGAPVLLRPGGISTVELEFVVGPILDGRSGPARASGMLASHYAPRAVVTVVDDQADLRRALTAAMTDDPTNGETVGVMAPIAVDHEPAWKLPADAGGYAAELYATFRDADREGVDRLVVLPPSDGRLLDAVLDRLHKAAAPR